MSLNGSEIVSAAKSARHARAVRPAVRERAAAGLDEQRVHVAVIAALELDDLVAAGEPARQPKAGHRRLRAAVDHSHLLDRRDPAADQLGHFHFERIGNAEADAARGRLADRVEHDRRRVPEDRRAPGADVIDVFVAVDVPNPGALRAVDEERLAAEAAEGAHGGIHAAGDALAGRQRIIARNGMPCGSGATSNVQRPTSNVQ